MNNNEREELHAWVRDLNNPTTEKIKEPAVKLADYFGPKFIDERVKAERYAGGFIYFIESIQEGTVKIGYSTNPEKRIRSLQVANAGKLKLLCVIPGDRNIEMLIQSIFGFDHIRGEHFKMTNQIRDFVLLIKLLIDENV